MDTHLRLIPPAFLRIPNSQGSWCQHRDRGCSLWWILNEEKSMCFIVRSYDCSGFCNFYPDFSQYVFYG